MITFIPSWKNTAAIGESTDDLIGQIRSFILSEQKYQVLIGDYVPNLRYFLHRFDLLESNYCSIFDKLQGFENKKQRVLEFDDLNFPKNVYFVYTPLMVMVFQGSELVGKIRMGEGSHISEVQHFQSSSLELIEVYDDRGFLSSRKFYKNNTLEYTEYLDFEGQEIFVQFAWKGNCVVNSENSHGLKFEQYDSLEALQFECLNAILSNSKFQQVIVSVTNENLKFLDILCQNHRVVLSIFKTHYQHRVEFNSQMTAVALKSIGITVDTIHTLNVFISLNIPKYKLYKISPFDTRFSLSITQELKDEVVYLETRDFEGDGIYFLLQSIIDYFWDEMIKDQTRSFKLFVRTKLEEKQKYSELVNKLFHNKFPEEISIIDEGNESELDTVILEQSSVKLSMIRVLHSCIDIQAVWSEEELFKIIRKTRLIIDLGTEPDLFTQIAGISAGIPQINKVKTEYVDHNKNGLILSNPPKLYVALEHYLSTLKHWQKARVFSIQKIKKYSGQNLCKKILAVFSEGT